LSVALGRPEDDAAAEPRSKEVLLAAEDMTVDSVFREFDTIDDVADVEGESLEEAVVLGGCMAMEVVDWASDVGVRDERRISGIEMSGDCMKLRR